MKISYFTGIIKNDKNSCLVIKQLKNNNDYAPKVFIKNPSNMDDGFEWIDYILNKNLDLSEGMELEDFLMNENDNYKNIYKDSYICENKDFLIIKNPYNEKVSDNYYCCNNFKKDIRNFEYNMEFKISNVFKRFYFNLYFVDLIEAN